MGKISEEDIALVMKEFEDLDVDQSGTLSASDIMAQATQTHKWLNHQQENVSCIEFTSVCSWIFYFHLQKRSLRASSLYQVKFHKHEINLINSRKTSWHFVISNLRISPGWQREKYDISTQSDEGEWAKTVDSNFDRIFSTTSIEVLIFTRC